MNLKDYISAAGYTQYQFARKMGVSNAAITNWTTGKFRPTPKNCRKMAELLGVTPKTIIESFYSEETK